MGVAIAALGVGLSFVTLGAWRFVRDIVTPDPRPCRFGQGKYCLVCNPLREPLPRAWLVNRKERHGQNAKRVLAASSR